jgi:uncharacterized protein (TIGR03118 family)
MNKSNFFCTLAIFLAAVMVSVIPLISSCSKSSTSSGTKATAFTQVNLIANNASFTGARVDQNLIDGWGIAVGSSGVFWINSARGGVVITCDSTGAQKLAPITIPSATAATGGLPTGQVFNSSTDFVIPGGAASRFIFSTEDGIIAAWASGSAAVKVADQSASNAVYKGLAIAADGTSNFLYASNFKGRKIDVFDKDFALVTTKPFVDPSIPANYAPFGIKFIDGLIYVTYARQLGPDNVHNQAGAGLGYVSIFRPDGTFVNRFISQGALNAPWGVAKAPAGFGTYAGAILVGNFGDGRVNAYQSSGALIGPLSDKNGNPIVIDGLWDIVFPTEYFNNYLYFSAGPAGETEGLFGYIKIDTSVTTTY